LTAIKYQLTPASPAWHDGGMNLKAFKPLAIVCRWTGRILGTLLLLVIALLTIGEGLPNPFTQPMAVQVGFLALAFTILGILAGWRWELAGGLISLAGWSLFVMAVTTPHRLNWFMIALALPGLLYAISALLRRQQAPV
jgi:hypothetical protein